MVSQNTKFRLICVNASKEIVKATKEKVKEHVSDIVETNKVMISKEMGGSEDSDEDIEHANRKEDLCARLDEENKEVSDELSQDGGENAEVPRKKKKLINKS